VYFNENCVEFIIQNNVVLNKHNRYYVLYLHVLEYDTKC